MNNDSLEIKIKNYVDDILTDESDLFLVGLSLKGNAGNRKLGIFLDGDDGISIDQCSSVSRQLASRLEEEDLIDGKYVLEVSSAGIDQPLTMLRQYKKNIGRSLKVQLEDGLEVQGKLIDVLNENEIKLSESETGEVCLLKLSSINKTKVLVSFK